MKKFPLLAVITFIFFSGFALSQNLKKNKNIIFREGALSKIENSYIKIYVENSTGKFTVLNSENKTILFYDSTRQNLFTGHFNIKIEDSIYSNEKKISDVSLTNQLFGRIYINKNNIDVNYYISSFKLSVIQRLTPVTRGSFGGVFIEYIIQNNDSVPHRVGLLKEFDTEMNMKEGSPIKTDLGIFGLDTSFENKLPLYWQVFESFGSDSGMIGEGFLRGLFIFKNNSDSSIKAEISPPDYMYISDWEKLFNVLWDYSPKIGDKYYDGGVLLKWKEKVVQPFSSFIISNYIGKGESILDSEIYTSISIPKITFTGNRYEPNPFNLSINFLNTTQHTIANITGKINIPGDLRLDTGSNTQNLVMNFIPGQSEVMNFPIIAPFSTKPRTLTFDIEIQKEGKAANYQKNVYIPAALNFDFFNPAIEYLQTSCSFTGIITEDSLYDTGIDSVLIDSIKNIDFKFEDFISGIRKINFSGKLLNIDSLGYAVFRVKDLAGNITRKDIKVIPYSVGFDSIIEVTPGKTALLPLRLINFPDTRNDSSATFLIKYDTNFFIPESMPIITNNSLTAGFKISHSMTNSGELIVYCTGRGNFRTGTLAFLNFKVKEEVNDSSKLILESFSINDDKLCVKKFNSIIRASYNDSLPPQLTFTKYGNRIFGNVVDTMAGDRGIYSISFYYSENAKFKDFSFEPGSKQVNFIIECIDTLKSMNGVIEIIDGGAHVIKKYFENTPIRVEIDTVRATIFDKVIITPSIVKPLVDSFVTYYEYKLSYDTSVMLLTDPYYNTDDIDNNTYTISLDTTQKGIIFIKGSGKTLKPGSLIKFYFNIQPGSDTISPIKFLYFKMSGSEKFVAAKSSAVIRYSTDKKAPIISFIQNRTRILIQASENGSDNHGIWSITFKDNNNFTNPTIVSYSAKLRRYLLFVKDSTSNASITIMAKDFSDNTSIYTVKFQPVKINTPQNITGKEEDLKLIPIFIYNFNSLSIKKLKFSIEYDKNIAIPIEPFFTKSGTISERIPVNISQFQNKQSFEMIFDDLIDTNKNILFFLNYKFTKGATGEGELKFFDLSLNDDSLFIFGEGAKMKRYFTDTLPPVISSFQTGCNIKVLIEDKRKDDSRLSKIWMDSINNFKDSLFFEKPFNSGDSSATFNIIPLNSKLKSIALIYAKDNENNISKTRIEIKPLNIYFPPKIIFDTSRNIQIPIYLDSLEDQKIRKIDLTIQYDNTLIDFNSYSKNNTMLSESVISYEKTGDRILFSIIPSIKKFDNTLLNLNFTNKFSNSKSGRISLQKLSFNYDSLCVYTGEGILLRRTIDTLCVFIDTIRGRIGSTISIPVKVSNYTDNSIIKSARLKIKYNFSVLNPVSINITGTASENSYINFSKASSGILEFEANGNPYLKKSETLFYFNSKVLLGNESRTGLDVDSLFLIQDTTITEDRIFIKSRNGLFLIDSLCEWQKGLVLKSNYMAQNHPNPYNSSTNIIFSINKGCIVKLKIYDILGRLVDQPINEYYESGIHTIMYNAKNLTSGIYYYKIETPFFSQIRKMVLMK